MTIAELLLQDYDIEIAGARRTLERVPEHCCDFKPHDKSFAMGKLAMHVATLPHFGHTILTEPGLDMATSTRPQPSLIFHGPAQAVAALDEAAALCRQALANSSDEALEATWPFTFGQHVIFNGARSAAYRSMFFNHFIHHRAQLGVYLRLNNIAVPGLYGPSADEPFGA